MKAEKGQILLAFVIMGALWVLCMAVGAAGPKEPFIRPGTCSCC